MEKHLLKKELKLILVLVCSLFTSLLYAQEFVPLSQRTNEVIKGDMAVIGNTILGVRGVFDGQTLTPNGPGYTGTSVNGRNDFVRGQIRDQNGNLLYLTNCGFFGCDITTTVTPDPFFVNDVDSSYKRAYMDIDSDPVHASNFSTTFKSNLANTEYSDNNPATTDVDANGSPLVQGTQGTFSSSAAFLDVDNSCARVRKAFLYWSSVMPNQTFDNARLIYNTDTDSFEVVTERTPRNQFCGADCEDYTEVKILPPFGDQYYDISINPVATSNPGGLQLQTEVIVDGLASSPNNNLIGNIADNPYVCVADITDLFNAVDASGGDLAGYWTVANVQATTGFRSGAGLTGGWTLAVIYEDIKPAITTKSISFYDGYAGIRRNNDRVTFTTPTFNTIPDGPILAWSASAALEGDIGFINDRFSIQTATTIDRLGPDTNPIDEAPSNSVPFREEPTDNTSNFFNSTITGLTGPVNRIPNSTNTLGYDSDHFRIRNNNNSILDNGSRVTTPRITDTDATLILTTEGDTYGSFFTAFAIEVIAPDLVVEKRVFQVSGGVRTELTTTSTVEFGDRLEYELRIRNVGNDVATNIVLEDFLPVNTTLASAASITSGDFTVNPTVTNETFTDRITGVDYMTELISIPIPDITPDGDCGSGAGCLETVTLTFDVDVISECAVTRNACIDQISNVALATFQGIINPATINQKESFFAFPSGCNDLEQGPTITLANRTGRCDSSEEIICDDTVDLVAGLGFETYEWYYIPLSVADLNGNGIIDAGDDRNGNGIIDDQDFSPSDGTLILTSTASDPNPNVLNVSRANQGPGIYLTVNTAPGGCDVGVESFNVSVFDPLSPANNPLKQADGTPILDGAILPSCSVNPDLETIQFIVCVTPTEDSITIPTNYPNGTTLAWSRFVDGSCTRTDNNCPYISDPSAGNNCNYITDTVTVSDTDPSTSNRVINQTGNYRLTATTPDGCVATYYFNTILINNGIDLAVTGNPICGDTTQAEITGLPDLSITPVIGLTYDLEFFIDNGAGFPSSPNLVQDPDTVTPSEYGRITINRPAGAGPRVVNIRVIATPNLSGGSTISSCPEPFEDAVTFNSIELERFEFIREPSCDVDSPVTATDDETKGDLRVEVTAGSPQYFYQLIDVTNPATPLLVRTSGPKNGRGNTFRNIDPDIDYKIRVFAANEPTIPLTATLPISTVGNTTAGRTGDQFCALETGVVSTPSVDRIDINLSIQKVISCTPGELLVDFPSGVTPPANAASIDFEIETLNTSGVVTQTFGGTGIPSTIVIDDITNRPVDPDPVDPNITYVDLSTVTDLQVTVVSNPSCAEPTPIPSSLAAYSGIRIAEEAVENVNCNGQLNGGFTVAAYTADTSTNTAYVSPYVAAVPTITQVLEYDIDDATAPTTTPASALDPQTDPVYTGLPAGTYTVTVTDVSVPTDACPSEAITIIITEPQPLISPQITEEQEYTCTPAQQAIIRVTDAATFNFEGTGPYTFRLINNQNTADPSDDVVISTTTSTAYTDFTSVTEGNYVVQIVDDNGCTSVFSNQIDIDPLPIITIDPVVVPDFRCTGTTLPDTVAVDVDASATNGVIEGYRIIASTNATIPVSTSDADFASNTTGAFNLPVGDYIVETRTTAGNCRETVDIEVLQFLPIQVVLSGSPVNVACFGDSTGEANFTVTRFDATRGYNFTLTGPTPSNSTTPETSNSLSFTDLAAGDYTLTVNDDVNTDASGCLDTVDFTITEPLSLPSITANTPVYNCEMDEYTFTVTPSGGSTTPNYTYFIDGSATGTTDPIITVAAPTVARTVSVQVQDIDGTIACIGNTLNVPIDPITAFTATLNNTSQLCLPETTSIIIDVTGTAPFTYKLSTDASFTTATVTGGQITIANPPTLAGNYTYEIFDANFSTDACKEEISITINDPITSSIPFSPVLDCSMTAPSGSLPTTGEFISFTISGGDGTYTPTITNVTAGGTVTIVDADATPNGFRFDFDSTTSGDNFEISIEDGTGCTLPNPISFTPVYPEAPVITNVTATPILCNGDDSTVQVVPVGVETSFEYSFDGGTTYQTASSTTLGAGNYDVVIRNIATECISAIFPLMINEPDAITELDRTIVPVICDTASGSTTLGSFSLEVQGGTGTAFTYELFDSVGDPVTTINDDATVTFPMLDIGDYSIRVSETVGTAPNTRECTASIVFTIPPSPDINITNRVFDSVSCLSLVTFYFEVTGGSDPDFFRIGSAIGITPVVPSISGDNIHRFGDTDFPTPSDPAILGTFTDTARLFAITLLDFNTDYDVTVIDDISSCLVTAEETTPMSPSSDLTITILEEGDTGACNPNSGFVDITFTTGSPTENFEVDIINTTTGATVVPTILYDASNPATATTVIPRITGLSVGSYRARINQVTGPTSCNTDVEPFTIGRAEPLVGPILVSNLAANCDRDAQVVVRSEEGTPAYSYTLSEVGPTDDPTPTSNFLLGNTIDIDVTDAIITPAAATAALPNRIGQVEVWVKDQNNCISGPLVVDVLEDRSPEINLDAFSPEECNPTGPYTIGFTIDNYFVAQEPYAITVNGATPSPANITLGTPSPANQVTGTLTVNNRISYNVEIVGNLHPTCTDNDNFNIDPTPLSVSVDLENVDCDGDIPSITATVTGGFEVAPNRSLTYELLDGATSIATQTITGTTATFTNGVAGVTLEGNITYTISVVDTFDSTAATPRTCSASDTDENPIIRIPAFDTPILTNLQCPGSEEGQIELTITTAVTDTPPLEYRLYEFPAGLNPTDPAPTAITNGTVISSGTLVTTVNVSNERLFENLKEDSEAVYVPVMIATALNCPVIGTPITLTAPNELQVSDFSITEIRQGICNDSDTDNDTAIFRIEVLNQINGASSTYQYSVAGGSTNVAFSSNVGTTFDVELTPETLTNRTVNVTISDIFTNCDPITLPLELDPCPIPIDPLALVASSDDIDCFNETDGVIRFTVGPAVNSNPLRFTYTLIGGTPQVTRTSGGDLTTATEITESNLPPGTYTLTIIDRETGISTVDSTLEIERPTSLPDFNVAQIDYNCVTNQVTLQVTPVAGSGTPNYTIQLDDPATAATPDFENTTGLFANVPAPIVGDPAIVYNVTIIDDNNCPVTKMHTVDPQPQLDFDITENDICLPNTTDATGVEIEIDITSGTPPYRWARALQTDPVPAESAFTALAPLATSFVDTAITTSGTYEYYVRDRFNCAVNKPVTIAAPLVLGTVMRTEPNCILPFMDPQTRSNGIYDFTAGIPVTGGSASYSFEIARGTSATTLGAFMPHTSGFPFNVAIADDGVFFQFRITDNNTNCSILADPFSFDFPNSPRATAPNASYFCASNSGTVTVSVTSGTGESPFSYTYFESGETTPLTVPDQNTFTGQEGVYDYIVRDANNCEFRGSFAIDDLSVNIQGVPRVTNITCTAGMPNTDNGEISIDVVGGGPLYNFRLLDNTGALNGSPNAAQTNVATLTPFTVTFPMLEAGVYSVEITDGNSCTPVTVRDIEVEAISPIDLGVPRFDEDCTIGGTGVSLMFSITGTAGPFEILSPEASAAASAEVYIDPVANTSTTDDITRFGDADFPVAFTTLLSGLAPAVQNTFFAIKGLDFSTDYTVKVNDLTSGCPQQRTYTTPDNTDVEITSIPTLDESFCTTSPDDGEAIVNFSRLAGAVNDYQVVLLDPNNFNAEIVGTLRTITVDGLGNGTTTYTGLDQGSYIARVTLDGTPCGDSEGFIIESAPELQLPSVTSSLLINCNTPDPSNFPVQVSSSGGRLDYNFRIDPAPGASMGDPLPVSPASPLGGTVSATGTSTINIDASTEDSFILWIEDNSTCGIRGTRFFIDREPLPILTIDPAFSKNQCDDVTVYSFDVQVTNYDATLAPYTFFIDGVTQTLISPDVVSIPGQLLGELQVTGTGTFNVRVTNKNNCEDIEPITIFEPLAVTATLGAIIDCDNNISTIEAEVTGGFATGARTLTYQLVDADAPTTILSTITNSIGVAPTDTAVFTVATTGTPLTPQLTAGVNYQIRVIDDYGATVGAPSCDEISLPVRRELIQRSTLSPATVNQPNCSSTVAAPPRIDGSIRINPNTNGDTPITYELYLFADQITADAAVVANDPTGGTSQGASITDVQLFEGLSPGFYVDFVRNTNIASGCITAGAVYEIVDPNIFDGSNIAVSPVQPTCDPAQNAELQITVADVSNGTAPYFYRLNSTSAYTIIPGTDEVSPTLPIVINVPATRGTTYNDIEFRDNGNTVCGTFIHPSVTLNDLIIPQATIAQNTAFSCVTDEEITVSITNTILGDSYSISVINQPLGSPAIADQIVTAIATTTASFTITAPGDYDFRVTHLGLDPVATTDDTGCSFDIDYRVEDVEALRVRAIPPAEQDCSDDTTTIMFEVQDFEGFFRYTVTNTTTSTVQEDAIVETASGVVTPITVSTGTPAAIFDAANTTTTVTTGIDLAIENYRIDVIAVPDSTVPVVTPSVNPLCTNTTGSAVVGPTQALSLVSVDVTSLLTCANTATITAVAQGGTPPYTYTLSLGATPQDDDANPATVNTSGFFGADYMIGSTLLPAVATTTPSTLTYTVTVVDAKGCTAMPQDQIITAPVPPTGTIANTTPINCIGDLGTIELTLTTPPSTAALTTQKYTLVEVDDLAGANPRLIATIDNPDIDFENVPPGPFGTPRFYRVDIVDGFGCTAMTNTIPLVEPEMINTNSLELIPINCITTRPQQGGIETAQYQITASGGVAPFTFIPIPNPTPLRPPLVEPAPPTIVNLVPPVLVNNRAATFEISTGTAYFRIVDGNGCEAFTSISVGPAPAPITYDLDFNGFNPLTDEACFGENQTVEAINVRGGVPGFTYELAEVSAAPVILPDASFPTVTHVAGTARFSGLPGGTYRYTVRSGACPPVERLFTINQFPEVIFDTSATLVSFCDASDIKANGTLTVNLTAGIQPGDYTATIIREQGTIDSNLDGIIQDPTAPVASLDPRRNGLIDGNIDDADAIGQQINMSLIPPSVTFNNLEAGDYTVIITTPNNCNPAPIAQTIDLTPEFVVDRIVEILPDCKAEQPSTPGAPRDLASQTYNISGGTPPYYYRIVNLSAGDPIPTVNEVFGKSAFEINIPTVTDINFNIVPVGTPPPTIPMANDFFVEFDFENNTAYKICIVDSGDAVVNATLNTSTGDLEPNEEFSACLKEGDLFNEVPELGGFTVVPSFNCPDPLDPFDEPTYDLTVLGIDAGLDVSNLTYVLTTTDNDPATADTPVVVSQLNDNVFTDVPLERLYEVSLSYTYTKTVRPTPITAAPTITNPICETIPTERVTGELLEYTPAEFTFEVVNTSDVDPVTGLPITITTPYFEVGLNEYQIRPQFGNAPYTFEVNRVDRTGNFVSSVNVDNTGTFKITETGFYEIIVKDTLLDAPRYNGGCTLSSGSLEIVLVDIVIPNVFTPDSSSGNIETSTWYPDSLISTTRTDPITGNPVRFGEFNNLEVMVFDRYGRLLQEFKGIKDRTAGEGWDGTYQGKRMPSGDYWYLIKLNDERGREFTGHFTLYRQ